MLHMGQTVKNEWSDMALLLFNADTLLRKMDGWENQGLAYKSIKGGIDKAMSDGYKPGQIGYARRSKENSDRIKQLFSVFDAKDIKQFKKGIKIPGVRKIFTRSQVISILLHSSYPENIIALTESPVARVLPCEEWRAIVDSASKKDLDFVQSIWDYIDEFFPEVQESTIHRKNFRPEPVEAQEFETPHGTYRGGYVPLIYDGDGIALGVEDTAQDIREEVLYGGYTSGYTRDGHSRKRNSNLGRKLDLDLFHILSHLDQLIFDLEVGEAITDAYEILHHKDLKASFRRIGRLKLWEALDLWFRDIVTGEIKRGEFVI